MHLVCALLAAGALAGASGMANLAFTDGRLTGWTGQGFYITTGRNSGPSLRLGVCSSDGGRSGRMALLHRTFVVPRDAGVLQFTAAAVRPAGLPAGAPLNITLEAGGGRFIPCQVRTAQGWHTISHLLPLENGRPREYCWPVQDLIGRQVRIVLHDADERPGCYLYCSGFRFLSAQKRNSQEFAAYMSRLQRRHHLAPMARRDSKHFVAIGNAADEYTDERLYNCETIYTVFFAHFRKKGFALREPGVKLMAAVFDSQAGFESYIGPAFAATVTGIYDPATNRLVVYDYARNRDFVAHRKKAAEMARQLQTPLERQRYTGGYNRYAQTYRADVNLGTIMHEVAHQLSFNSGLLNRHGDVPAWLGEGLATYCEAAVNGSWQGIGEPNPMRAGTLAAAARGERPFLPLRSLLGSDDWLRKNPDAEQRLLGYAQSWALFRLLMEQHPGSLRRYLTLLFDRRTPEHRLADWGEVFGANLATFEKQYIGYLRQLVRQEARAAR